MVISNSGGAFSRDIFLGLDYGLNNSALSVLQTRLSEPDRVAGVERVNGECRI